MPSLSSPPTVWRPRSTSRRRRGEIEDDHTPFAEAGVPAVDLIDFDYPCFHEACDTPARLSGGSLASAERAVLELLRTTLGHDR